MGKGRLAVEVNREAPRMVLVLRDHQLTEGSP